MVLAQTVYHGSMSLLIVVSYPTGYIGFTVSSVPIVFPLSVPYIRFIPIPDFLHSLMPLLNCSVHIN